MLRSRLRSHLCLVVLLSLSIPTKTKQIVENFRDQLGCMVDYLDQRDRNAIDIYVEIQLSDSERSLLLGLLSSRLLFARLLHSSPAASLRGEAGPTSAPQVVWFVPETDSASTSRLFEQVRGDDGRRWLLVSLSGRRDAHFLRGYAPRHAYMIDGNGTTRFHSARDYHREWWARGECRGARYVQQREVDGITASRGAMRGVHLRLLYANEPWKTSQETSTALMGVVHEEGRIKGGLIGSLILLLQEILGFSYSLHPVGPDHNTTAWDRIVYELNQGRGEMTAGRLTYSLNRLSLVVFSHPLQAELAGVAIASKYTRTLSDFRVGQPLTSGAWRALVLTQLAAVLVLCLIARCQQRLRSSLDEPADETNVSFWALTVFAVTCQQSAAVRSDAAHSYRVAITALYLFSLFITACYSGNLLADMALSRRVMPFDSLQEALDQGWKVTDDDVGLAMEEMVVQPLFGRRMSQLPRTSGDPTEGRNFRITTSSRAEVDSNCTQLGRHEPCEVCLWPGTLVHMPVSLSFSPSFAYRHLFNFLIPQLLDRGVVSREMRRWQTRRPYDMVCPEHTLAPLQKTFLGTENLRNVFLVVGYGLVSSAAVLVCEVAVHALWTACVRKGRQMWRRNRKVVQD
ncbi:uncharacterized protein LOC122389686 [Amphibalanus amphitrite]|uniref:uncharacterized protein LOC122389686 n=1 Tax=Amphibalanus amphitrite TaxID=1232801 RepID=UPI001C90FB4D|nr:uncharacterized protein LOC122389686 [Amphibalanus amphitrite]